MQLSDYKWLVSDDAAAILTELAGSAAPPHQQLTQLRRSHSPQRAALLVEQVELRRRAAAKFSRPERMFFTRLGLEQATDESVARYKSLRFAKQGRVADICCGVGGDLLALADGRPASAVDSCPLTLCLALANARAAGRTDVHAREQDARQTPVAEFSAWHVDPDRRAAGRRTIRIEAHSPDLATLDLLHARQPNAAIKLAPATEPPAHWTSERECEWISRTGECKQLVVWSGELAEHPGSRRATSLSTTGEVQGVVRGAPSPPPPIAAQLGEAIYEPDAALFAADLAGLVAQQHGLRRVSSEGGYLTGPLGVESPLLAGFVIDDLLPLRAKRIAEALRARGLGRLEIKQRGGRVNLPELRKQLKLTGESSGVLLLTRREKKPLAILARRMPRNRPE